MVKQLAGGEPDVPGAGERPRRRIPEATVARLPLYLRSLFEAAEAKTATVSSERLAEMAGVNAAKVRKDLSYLGSYGTRGVGYDVEYLLFQISRELGLTQDWPVVIVGVGNLGHALANYRGFGERGFRVVALVDSDEAKVGEGVNGLTVRHIDDLPAIVREREVAIGVVCTPAAVAQEVADRMVDAGIRSTCNRVEVVAEVDSYHAGLQAVRGFLSESREVPAEEFDSVLISRYEEEAVRHQFALAAGIDSMVIGEPQILSQVREAIR